MDSIQDIDTFLSAMDLPDRILKIVDVGAHSGKFTKAVRDRHKCISFMFEPSPVQFENLVTNFPNDFVFNYGISDHHRVSGFVCYGNDLSQLDRVTDSKILEYPNKLIEITIVSINEIHHSILANNHIDILKIDTEGQELNVLKGASDLLKKKAISNIIFEVGGTFLDLGYRVGDVIEYLNSFGYKVFDGATELDSNYNKHHLHDLFAKCY